MGVGQIVQGTIFIMREARRRFSSRYFPAGALLGLAVILAFAGFFYFYRISEQGIFTQDEARYLIVSNTYATLIGAAVNNYFFNSGQSFSDVITSHASVGFSTLGKPLYIFLTSFIFFIFGRHDYIAFITNGIIGLFSIVVLYFLTISATKNVKLALLASLIFGISGYQIFFARSGNPHVLAGLFLLLGSLAYSKTLAGNGADSQTRRNLIAAGFFWGFLFTAHYITGLVLLLIFVFECIRALSGRRIAADCIRRLVYLFIPAAAVVAGAAAFIFFFRSYFLPASFPFNAYALSYFMELYRLFNAGVAYTRLITHDPLFFFRMLNILNGMPFMALFLAAPAVFFAKKWHRDPQRAFIFFVTFLTFAVVSTIPIAGTRSIVLLNGFISFVVALILYETFTFEKRSYRIAAAALAVILIGIQLQKNFEIINIRSGYKQAADFIVSSNLRHENIYSSLWPISDFYLDKVTRTMDERWSEPSKMLYRPDPAATPGVVVAIVIDRVRRLSYAKDELEKVELLAAFDNPVMLSRLARFEQGDYRGNYGQRSKIFVYRVWLRTRQLNAAP